MGTSGNLHRYMRSIHHYVGYLTLGFAIVYALSGITMVYRNTDFLKVERTHATSIAVMLTPERLKAELKLRDMKVLSDNDSTIVFDAGVYSKLSGEVTYTTKEYVVPIDKFAALHKVNSKSGVHIVGILFGAAIFTLAVTSLFIFPTKSKQFAGNMVVVAVGVAICILISLAI